MIRKVTDQSSVIPAELRALRQWMTWSDVDGRKLPNGKSNDPKTWSAFEPIEIFDNIAFVFSADDPYTGIDLDGCIVAGEHADWVEPILECFKGVAYGEVSPSGTGIKLITKGKKTPNAGCVYKIGDGKQQIECYDNRRFWTITQDVVNGFETIGEGQTSIDWLCETFLIKHHPAQPTNGRQTSLTLPGSNKLERASKYLATIDPAIQFCGGDNQAFIAACVLVKGFDLSVSEAFNMLWDEYNPRCVPPWTEQELVHKVKSADALPGPRGTKLESNNLPAPAQNRIQGSDYQNGKPKSTKVEPQEKYKAFPVHTLPSPMDALVCEGAKAIGCDESFIALPLLSCVGAAIGNTTRLVVKKGWAVPPSVWTMIVGESGTAKSPAFKVAKAPMQRFQKAKLDDHAEQMAAYELAIEQFEMAKKEHKKSKSTEPGPTCPDRPSLDRIVVSDTTVEALAPILSQNPRGLLLQRDELNGWLGSFNQYKSAKGADESAWLSMFDGESITVDRKGEGTIPTYVESALVSITGGIQPAVLAASMTREHRSSGMASRFLIASPPRKTQVWTDDEISDSTQLLIDRLFIKLLSIGFASETKPLFIGLSSEAKHVFREFFNEHHQEQIDLTGDSAAAWSKLLGYVPRISLLFHVVKQLTADGDVVESVEASTVHEAIELVTWFKQEAARLYATIDDTDDQRELRELAAWIDRKHGGQCTPSDMVRGVRWIGDVAAAEEQAKLLVRAGLAVWGQTDSESGTGPQKRVLQTT